MYIKKLNATEIIQMF